MLYKTLALSALSGIVLLAGCATPSTQTIEPPTEQEIIVDGTNSIQDRDPIETTLTPEVIDVIHEWHGEDYTSVFESYQL